MLNYGTLLKTDEGTKFLCAYRDLIVGLCILDKTEKYSPYLSATLANFFFLMDWKRIKHPAFKVFLNFPSLFNEEIGEISLSVISRLVVSDTHKDTLSNQNLKYSLLRLYHQITREFVDELNLKQKERYKTPLSNKSPEVSKLSKWLLQQCKDISENNWETYEEKKEYPSLEIVKEKNMIKKAQNKPLLWIHDIESLIKLKLKHVSELLEQTYDPAGAFRDKICGGNFGIIQPNYADWLCWRYGTKQQIVSEANSVSNALKNKELWEIADILDHRQGLNGPEFLVEWKDFHSKHNSWVKYADLHASRLLKQYLFNNSLEILSEDK